MNKFMYGSKKSAVALSITLLLAGCGGSGSSDETGDSLELTQDTAFAFVERSTSATAADGLTVFQKSVQTETAAPQDLNSPYAYQPGAQLIHRSSLDTEANQWEVLSRYLGTNNYDVKDLSISADGRRLLLAARGPDDHPSDHTWNIYEYTFATREVRRIITSDTLANAGQDTNPTYTADGRIVFSSDRAAGNPNHSAEKTTAEQDENCYKIGPAQNPSLLHVMTAQGSDIVQLTFGNNHDVETTTLADGRIAFVRWSRSYQLLPNCGELTVQKLELEENLTHESLFPGDYPSGLDAPSPWSDGQLCDYAIATPLGQALPSNHYTLLAIDPDTEQLAQLYDTVTIHGSDEEFVFLDDLAQGQNGYLIGLMKHFYNQHLGGGIVTLQDPANAAGHTIFGNLAPRPLVSNDINLYPNQPSANGWYSAVAPYRDGTSRLLISWSQCITERDGVSAFCNQEETGRINSEYGIWVYDPNTDSRLPVVKPQPDKMFTELAVAQNTKGLDLPFEPFNTAFVDNLDESRLICDDPSPIPPSGDITAGDDTTDTGDTGDTTGPGGNGSTDTEGSGGSGDGGTDTGGSGDTGDTGGGDTGAGDTVGGDTGGTGDTGDTGADGSGDTGGTGGSDDTGGTGGSDDTDGSGDTGGSSGSDNHAPVANAGADQDAVAGIPVTLDGSASYDPDGDPLSYRWTFLEVSPGSTLSDDDLIGRDTPHPQFTPDQGVEIPIEADFVFIIDGSASMQGEIDEVRNGLRNFVETLSAADTEVDARFAVVTFEERPLGSTLPVVRLGFTASTTEADVADQVIAAFDAIDTSYIGPVQREAGLEAIRVVLADPTLVSAPLAGLEFRPQARKNLILVTDEDSDGPYNGGDFEPPDSITDGGSEAAIWQNEIDRTATLIIDQAAFVDLLIRPGDTPSLDQYGDPAADRLLDGSDRFDPEATLAALEDPVTGHPNSLQAQVLRAGLIARSYEVMAANDPAFVNSFFNSKVSDIVDNPLLGIYVLGLVVSDGELDSVQDSVTVRAFADD